MGNGSSIPIGGRGGSGSPGEGVSDPGLNGEQSGEYFQVGTGVLENDFLRRKGKKKNGLGN